MDEARLQALATRIAQLEAAQNAGDARLDVVAKAVEEATVEQGQAAAAVAAHASPRPPAIDYIAAAAEAAAAGGYAAPRVQLLLPAWGTGCTATTSTPAAGSASSATTRASRVKHKGAGAGVAAAAAGSVYIRDFLPPADEARVEALRASLPVDVPYEDNPVSHARSLHKRYFNDAPPGDADAWIVPLFEAALRAALGPFAAPPRRSCTVLPRFRWIEYETSQGMAAHTDGSMQHPQTLRRGTHTFLYYSRTCARGGETDLLESVAPGAAVLASVAPERNALLLFAGKAAHVGREVLPGEPKIVLRGDVYFDDLSPGDALPISAPSAWTTQASCSGTRPNSETVRQ